MNRRRPASRVLLTITMIGLSLCLIATDLVNIAFAQRGRGGGGGRSGASRGGSARSGSVNRNTQSRSSKSRSSCSLLAYPEIWVTAERSRLGR